MALVKRDPFARQELHRENEYDETQTCMFCGQQRKSKSGKAYLYRFYVETDSGHTYYDKAKFCSLSCRTSYYG